MAKTKISELEKEFGADRKDIISFLNDKGIEAKTANSSVDDDAVSLVAARFSKKNEVKEQKVEDKPVVKVATVPAGQQAQVTPVKKVKKKKIIIVTGAGKQNKPAGQSAPQGQAKAQAPARPRDEQKNQGRGPAAPAQAYRPIKPKTAPSQIENANPRVPVKTVKAVKATPAAPAAEAPVSAPAVKEAPVQEVKQETAPAAQENVQAKTPEQQPAKAPAHETKPTSYRVSKDEPIRNGRVVGHVDLSKIHTPRPSQGQGQQLTHDGRRIRTNDNMNRQGGQGGYNRGGQGGYNRQGQGGQGGYNRGGQGGYNRQGQGGQGGYNRGGQAGPGRGPQAGGGRGGFAAQSAPAFGQNAGGAGGDRRRNNFSKDKRNRKDMAFAGEELREKNLNGKYNKRDDRNQEAAEEKIKVITIPEKLTIGELADAMHMKAAELIKKLFLAGKMMTVNSEISYEEAENIASDYEILCEKEVKVDEIQELLKEDAEDESKMVNRAPVICVMGHVDHGKTSILDYIRQSHVTAKEAGGITQAIGAYTVTTEDGREITFLDTPGHEAFTAMRLRGAMSTDIAVLVVAADDGVMPQTVEAINHAKAAGVEIIVAVNKIDKPDANPDRVKEQLSKYELIPSDWGGTTEFVNVSAKSGQGIDDLLDTILLTADVLELKANPDRLARGLVLEARLDRGRGPVANVLVQKGTLHVGDFVSAGPAFGKVRAMINDKGENVREAGPSTPVMVMGLSDVPSAGEVIVAHESNDLAKSYAETYKAQHKEELVAENVMSMNVEDLFDQMREGKIKNLELIVKADVQGSVEALCASLQKLSNDEVAVKIIHSAVGNITESDVTLAEASNAAIIGFNVHPDATAKSIADHGGVSIHLYKVIYQAIDDVDAALKGMLAPVYEEKVIGHAEVRQIFKSGKIGNIAGSMVMDGLIEKGCSVRITRDKDKVFEGDLESLKRFKDDVKEVKAGFDCGLVFKDWDEMQVGDQIEAYKMVEVPREQVIAMKEKEKAAKEKAAKAAQAAAKA